MIWIMRQLKTSRYVNIFSVFPFLFNAHSNARSNKTRTNTILSPKEQGIRNVLNKMYLRQIPNVGTHEHKQHSLSRCRTCIGRPLFLQTGTYAVEMRCCITVSLLTVTGRVTLSLSVRRDEDEFGTEIKTLLSLNVTYTKCLV